MAFVICEIDTGRLRPLVGNEPTTEALESAGWQLIEIDEVPALLSNFKGIDGIIVEKSQAELDAESAATAALEQAAKVAAIKQEANRRIVEICPEWKQRNLTAQAAQLAKKGEANWTQAEASAWDAGEALWTQIEAIRSASDEIEAMDPQPVDITASNLWP